MKILRQIVVVTFAIMVQLLVVMQFTCHPVNLAKIPYRLEQRGEATIAAMKNPTPENKATLQAELRLAEHHVASRQFAATAVVLVAILGFEGLLIYLGRKHTGKSNALA
jgi:hypothetical protein